MEKRYLRNIPVDPFTESATSWQIIPPSEEKKGADEKEKKGKVYNVKSGAEGRGSDGTEYREW